MSIPEKIGHYEIKAELGRGGMATVYRAYDLRFEREVAIKVLPREMLHDSQFRARFEREAKTIALLEHPAIVPVYDVGEDDGQPYFVMRYMTGGSLEDRMKNGPMPMDEVARIIDRIAAALDHAHSRGIVHRDLKPANILFDSANEPYLSDFGIAKLVESQTNMTGSGIIGTPTYMSPEQAQGETVDGRSDIYTLGVIMYELLSGMPPYKADTPMGIVVKHITEPIPHILDANPVLHPAVEDLIERAMAKSRDDRFATAGELADALEEIVLGETSGDEKTRKKITMSRMTRQKTGTFSKPAAKPVKRKSPWGLVVALIVLAGLAAAGFMYYQGNLPFLSKATPAATASEVAAVPSGTPALTSLPETTATSLSATQTSSPDATVTLPPETSTPAQPVETAAVGTVTDTPASAEFVALGGADKIAFLAGSNVWMMNVDGTALTKLTSDNVAKSNLQWLPDGNTLIYITGKCVATITVDTDQVNVLTCFDADEYFEGFQVSPDGGQVAVSVGRELYVVPFDVPLLQSAHTRADLAAMGGCLTYLDQNTKDVRWSSDSQQIAVLLISADSSWKKEVVRVLDIQQCGQTEPSVLNEFPGANFVMNGYHDRPFVPDFSWDGTTMFLLNSLVRNEGYGDLYSYDLVSHQDKLLDPIEKTCCYRDARWSPDGTYIIFAFQDLRLGPKSKTQIYYIPFDSIGTNAAYQPFAFPEDFVIDIREKLQFALRPAQ
jgi:serine/threonine protein kinase